MKKAKKKRKEKKKIKKTKFRDKILIYFQELLEYIFFSLKIPHSHCVYKKKKKRKERPRASQKLVSKE